MVTVKIYSAMSCDDATSEMIVLYDVLVWNKNDWTIDM
jgi:hypothetical protein